MVLDFNEDLLYNLAYECESQFEELLQAFQETNPDGSIVELCSEYQQRFAIWTAYLGVFARKSQCLDARLRNFPDLQDLVARLLDILRRSLQHCSAEMASQSEKELVLISDDEFLPGASQMQKTALERIGDIISRLNRLGITIRRSSSGTIDARAEIFATDQNMDSFACLCAKAVQALYPGASQILKDYLSQSMMRRYARMSFSRSRNQNLKARREALPSIKETRSNEAQQINPLSKKFLHPAVSRLREELNYDAISDLSGVDMQQITSRGRGPDEASTTFYKTSSIQVKHGNYPQPPRMDEGNNIFACEWCGEPLDKKKLSKTDWRYVFFFFFSLANIWKHHNSLGISLCGVYFFTIGIY